MVQKNLAGSVKIFNMKNILLFLLLLSIFAKTQAQQLTGLWYSDDSSRVYEIKETGSNNFTATIKYSERKNDSTGFTVIKNLTFNNHKKRYEGVIYAVADGKPTVVKIKFDKKDPSRIILKLDRMLMMDVTIYWTKAAGSSYNQSAHL
jgi:uncharacterized protein (DUF2147 family)